MYSTAQQTTNMHPHAWVNRQTQLYKPSHTLQNASQLNIMTASGWLRPAASSQQQQVWGDQTNTSQYGLYCDAQAGGRNASAGSNLHQLVTNLSEKDQKYAQNSWINAQNVSTVNVTHHLQDAPAQWNQQVAVNRNPPPGNQHGDVVSNQQHFRAQENVFQNVNVTPANPVSAYTTRATSHPHEQAGDTSRLQSVPANTRDYTHRQNDLEPQFPLPFSPPPYNQSASLPLGNNNISTNPTPYNQPVSNFTCNTQQYQTQFTSTHSREATTHSLNPNTHSSGYENRQNLPQTHVPPLNPVTEEQMIQRIAQDLRQRFPADVGSTYLIQRVTQNMQPVTTAANANSNRVFQSSSISGASLPNTTPSITSATQHSPGVPPQENYPPSVVGPHGPAGERVNGRKRLAHSPKTGPTGHYKAKLSLKLSNVGTTPSGAVEKNRHMINRRFAGGAIDGSNHPPAGHTGTRAVAVVQPLPLESNQPADGCTSPDDVRKGTKDAAEDVLSGRLGKSPPSPEVSKNSHGAQLDLGNQEQRMPNHSLIMKLLLSTGDATNQDLSQKQVCAADSGSEPDANMQTDQSDAATLQQSGEGTDETCVWCDEDKCENGADTTASGDKLDTVRTRQWTAAELSGYIQKATEILLDISKICSFLPVSEEMVLERFWDGDRGKLLAAVQAMKYKEWMYQIQAFCSRQVTPNTVVFSQIHPKCAKTHKYFHVLKDGEVLLQEPYRSSWLNVNERLDDIDKESGFEAAFKQYLHEREWSSRPDRVDSAPAETFSEVSSGVLSGSDLEDERASAVKATSIQNTSPDVEELPEASDPYSLHIQVLPPEEAKAIYEQVLLNTPQSIAKDSQPERRENSPVVDDKPDATDILIGSDQLSQMFFPIEEVCCLKRLLEVNLVSGKHPLPECDCQKYRGHGIGNDCTDDRETMIRPIFTIATEGENEADSGKKVNMHLQHESPGKTQLDFERDPKPKLIESDLTEDSSTENTSSSDSEIHSSPKVNYDQEMCEAGGSKWWYTPVNPGKSEYLPCSKTDHPSQTSNLQGICGKAGQTSTHKSTSSLETEEQFKVSAFKSKLSLKARRISKMKGTPKKSVGYSSDLGPQPKRRKVLFDINEPQPSEPKVKTATLALFGSAARGNAAPVGRKFRHTYQNPPEIISVTYSLAERKPVEPVPKLSIKKLIHEKWLSSFQQTIVHRKKKVKRRKDTGSKSDSWEISTGPSSKAEKAVDRKRVGPLRDKKGLNKFRKK